MDKNFWEQYYSINKEPFQPSSFAREVIQNISKNSTLLDVGCGNGRDSIFFANNSIIFFKWFCNYIFITV